MPTLAIEDDELVLRMAGWERLFAGRKEVRVPLDRVTGARLDDEIAQNPQGSKMPGSRVAGKLYAGTWLQSTGRAFWYVRPPRTPVVIELQNDPYKRWVVTIDDAEAWVRRLNRAADADGWFGGKWDE